MAHLPRLLVLLGLLAACLSPAPAVEAGDRAANTQKAEALRLAYAASPEYNPYDQSHRDNLAAANTALVKGDNKAAVNECLKGLQVSRYDIDLLMTLAEAYRRAGDTRQAEIATQLWMSTLDSILASGDGRSFKTAFRVINVAEEYALLSVMKARVLNQSLRGDGASVFDVIRVQDPASGKEAELYFNIDLPKKWLGRKQHAK